MNEQQYTEICRACDEVLLDGDSRKETVAIPWLHVLRPHPAKLSQYENLLDDEFSVRDFLQNSNRLARSAVGWIRGGWRAIISRRAEENAEQRLGEQLDILIVSHLLTIEDIGKVPDFYFSQLPEELRAKGHAVQVCLINHTGKEFTGARARWPAAAAQREVLAGSLTLLEEFRLLASQWRECGRLGKAAKDLPSGLRKKVYLRAAVEALSGEARSALRLSRQIAKRAGSLRPKILLVTYEGHAWERTAFAAARAASPSTLCVGYAHAAIFPLQHAALRNLSASCDPDVILAPGRLSMQQFMAASRLEGVKIGLLGSTRGGTPGRASSQQQNPICLVLPEGIASECLLMFQFTIDCVRQYPHMKFIWRLHPLVSMQSLTALNSRLQKIPENIRVSTASIDDDIAAATHALYRGTTAIVRAAAAGVLPIYLDREAEIPIDPLFTLSSEKRYVRNPDDLEKIHAAICDGNSDQQQLRLAAIRSSEEFYTAFDPDQVDKLLTKCSRI